MLLFLSCTYALKYRFTRSFLSLSGGFQRFPPLCFIMLNIFSHTLGDFVLFLVFIVLLLNFSLGFISFFDFLLIFFFEITFSFFLSRRFFSDVGFFSFTFFVVDYFYILFAVKMFYFYNQKKFDIDTHFGVFL